MNGILYDLSPWQNNAGKSKLKLGIRNPEKYYIGKCEARKIGKREKWKKSIVQYDRNQQQM